MISNRAYYNSIDDDDDDDNNIKINNNNKSIHFGIASPFWPQLHLIAEINIAIGLTYLFMRSSVG